jgi:hypothetical protein
MSHDTTLILTHTFIITRETPPTYSMVDTKKLIIISMV